MSDLAKRLNLIVSDNWRGLGMDWLKETATLAIAALSLPPAVGEWKMVPVEPTDEMEDIGRPLWLWYAGLPHTDWTLGKHLSAIGSKIELTSEEASATHLPKHVMCRILWRAMLAASPASPSPPRDVVVEAARNVFSMPPGPHVSNEEHVAWHEVMLEKLHDALAALEQEKKE